MTAPVLLFLAPPSFGDDEPETDTYATIPAPRRSSFSNQPAAGAVRMTRGAREAATGLNVSDVDVQRCLDAPADVAPDPSKAGRTRFTRAGITVVTGDDGMVLRVSRAGGKRR